MEHKNEKKPSETEMHKQQKKNIENNNEKKRS